MEPRLVPRYDNAAGGVCFLTHLRQQDGERIIDVGLTVDDLPAWGNLCMGETAVVALAEMVGMMSQAKVAALLDEHAVAVAERHHWEVRARAAETALEAMGSWAEAMR